MPDEMPAASSTPPWDAKRNQPKHGKIRRIFMWAALVALVGWIGYGLRPQPVEIETGAVTRGPITVHVVEEGKTRIRNRYIISAPVAGLMRRVTYKAGDGVKAGETVLASIEAAPPVILDPRTRSEAEARLSMTKSSEQRAGESLELARTAARFAQANWDRIRTVREPGSFSRTERDNAERECALRAGEVRAAEFALDVSRYEKAQAQAALLEMDHPVAGGQVVELRAPVSGRILKVIQESSAVLAQGTQLLEIGDPADLEIEAEILSRDAVAIQPGALVSVEQWGGDEPLQARVRRVEPAAFTKISALGVEEQRVFVLSDLVSPPAGITALGDRYRVEVRIAVWHRDDVLRIPSGAMFREGNQWKTFVLDHGNAKQVSIETGRSDGRLTEVLQGIEPGTEVLLHPPDAVKDGTRVKKRAGN